MDIHTAGLTNLLSPLAGAPAAYRANEDAYYASHEGWAIPALFTRLAAALRAPRRRPAAEPASILITQMA